MTMDTNILDLLARSPLEALALDAAVKATLVLAATVVAALAMARPSQLEGRLVAILDPDRRRRGPGRRAATMALLAAVLLLLPLAMLHLGTRAAAAQEPIAGKSPAADPAARMTVTGRVLDPAGKPVPDAAVMVIVQIEVRPTGR